MTSAVAVHTKGSEVALWVRMRRPSLFDEVGGGLERAAPDGALGDEGEEAFDLGEPGDAGRRENECASVVVGDAFCLGAGLFRNGGRNAKVGLSNFILLWNSSYHADWPSD
jgi:hypothetical protein